MRTANTNMTDHDLVVTLNAKFDAMAQDIRELKDGTTIQLSRNTEKIDKLEKKQNEIFTSLKVIRWSLGIISGIVLAIIALTTDILRVFYK